MNRYDFYDNVKEFKEKDLELKHYGIIGQKWGTRRWQNADGTFNEAGKERYFGKGSKTNAPEEKIGGKNSKQKIGSFDFKKVDRESQDDMFDPEKFDKSQKEALKYLRDNYDKDFADIMEDSNDTTGEWGDVDAEYEKYKENPLEYLREYSRDPKYNKLTDKDIKKAAKEGEKFEKELDNLKWSEKYNTLKDFVENGKYKEVIDEAINPFVKEHQKSIDRVDEIFKDFDRRDANVYALAGLTDSLMSGYDNSDNIGELAGMAYWYAYDDGNQGDNTAEYLYATIDKGVKANELNKLYDELFYSDEKKSDAMLNLKKDPFFKNIKDKYLDDIIERKYDTKFKNDSYDKLYNASETYGEPSDETKKAYAESKNIAKKLNRSCGNDSNGWFYLWKAVDNLGMNNINYKDLSDSDWDKINAEVNRLKG